MKVGGMPPLQKLARLKLELKEAIKMEAFEKAALLRDRIQDLEQQIKFAQHLSDE